MIEYIILGCIIVLMLLVVCFLIWPTFLPKGEENPTNTTLVCDKFDEYSTTIAESANFTCPLQIGSKELSYCLLIFGDQKIQIPSGVERGGLPGGNTKIEYYACSNTTS